MDTPREVASGLLISWMAQGLAMRRSYQWGPGEEGHIDGTVEALVTVGLLSLGRRRRGVPSWQVAASDQRSLMRQRVGRRIVCWASCWRRFRRGTREK
jgi:hypothetical protein